MSYAQAVRGFRVDRGVSQRTLALEIGVSQPLVARTESGTRRPEGPNEVAAVARALRLTDREHDQLLRLAGHWPSAFVALGPEDPTLAAVARALTHETLKDELRRAIDGVLSLATAALEAGSAAPVEHAPAHTPRRPGRRR